MSNPTLTEAAPDVTVAGLWFSTFQQFMNNWDWNHSVAFNPQTWNDRRLRGGPVIERPAAWSWNSYGETDSKQKLFYFCGASCLERFEREPGLYPVENLSA